MNFSFYRLDAYIYASVCHMKCMKVTTENTEVIML